jgi:hypothetical protein
MGSPRPLSSCGWFDSGVEEFLQIVEELVGISGQFG